MAKLRRDTHDSIGQCQPQIRPLRVVASGTLFLTYKLSVPNHPEASTVVRARSVEKARGGSANTILSLLAQFSGVDAVLVAPLGGNDEGKIILQDLENDGIVTRYCKVWEHAGVPTAWILHSAEDDTRAVINHNPLPDITHEEFVSLLGPLLAPENYPQPSPSAPPAVPSVIPSSPFPSSPRPSQSGTRPPASLLNPNSPAPFDWLHFEGRSVKTTLNNMTGLDGLARDRKWRSHCVFSVDVGRKGRQGVEALIPHADVLFLNKHYAETISGHYATAPRAFLLSLTSVAPSHALLVAHWGKDGAAALSMPTKEYFQSSAWVEEKPASTNPQAGSHDTDISELRSVRSGSDFWANGRSRTPSTSDYFSATYNMSVDGHNDSPYAGRRKNNSQNIIQGGRYRENVDNGYESQGSENDDDGIIDEVGGQDAFVAGMIYALSRRLLPGSPYTPSWTGRDSDTLSSDRGHGRWRLDECLRFATELSGRKARRREWEGLADEMIRAGWFEN